MTQINHELHLAWQVPCLVKLEGALVAPRIENGAANVMQINHEIHLRGRGSIC